jgi:hypothetical protein
MRQRVNDYVRDHPRSAALPSHLLSWAIGLKAAGVALVLVLACLLVGTVDAQNALPSDPLYSWKLTSEQVWRSVSPDPVQVDIKLSQMRAQEILLTGGQPKAQEASLAAY